MIFVWCLFIMGRIDGNGKLEWSVVYYLAVHH